MEVHEIRMKLQLSTTDSPAIAIEHYIDTAVVNCTHSISNIESADTTAMVLFFSFLFLGGPGSPSGGLRDSNDAAL